MLKCFLGCVFFVEANEAVGVKFCDKDPIAPYRPDVTCQSLSCDRAGIPYRSFWRLLRNECHC
jgi:hypothetical protein